MTKQIFFYGVQEKGASGMFFREFREPPVESDWLDEVSFAVDHVLHAKEKSVEPERDSSPGGRPH